MNYEYQIQFDAELTTPTYLIYVKCLNEPFVLRWGKIGINQLFLIDYAQTFFEARNRVLQEIDTDKTFNIDSYLKIK